MIVNTDAREWVSLRAVARLTGTSTRSATKLVRGGRIRSRHVAGLPDRQYSRSDVLKLTAEAESAPGHASRSTRRRAATASA